MATKSRWLVAFVLTVGFFALFWLSRVPPKGSPSHSAESLVWHRRGQSLYRQGKWEEALEAFWQAQKYAPSSPALWYDLALCLYRLERYPQALEAIQKSIAQRPQKVTYYLLRGQIYCALLQWEKGMGDFRRGDTFPFRWQLARALWLSGHPEEAKRTLKGLPQNHPLTLYLQGRIAWEEGEREQAVALFQRSSLPAAKLWLCRIFWEEGHSQKAWQLLETLPSTLEVALLRWEFALRSRQWDKALALVPPSSSFASLYRAQNLLYQGEVHRALEELAKASRPRELLWKGLVHALLGERQKAVQCWKKARKRLFLSVKTFRTASALALLEGKAIPQSPLLGRSWRNDALFWQGVGQILRGEKVAGRQSLRRALAASLERDPPYEAIRLFLQKEGTLPSPRKSK